MPENYTDGLQWHDDGEETLDDLVGTWSLGGTGEMQFRINKHYAYPALNEATYDPHAEVVMGSHYWKQRTELNHVYLTGTQEAFAAKKAEMFAEMRTDKRQKAKPKGKGKRKVAIVEEEADGDERDDPADDSRADKKGGKKKPGPWRLCCDAWGQDTYGLRGESFSTRVVPDLTY